VSGTLLDERGDGITRMAMISPGGLYRYWLGRRWGEGPRMVFVMLNPSTADGRQDDPTIRRCIGFAKREGCGGVEVVNLYALRATKPIHLLDTPDPEGPDNPLAWAQTLYPDERDGDEPLGPVVAAWGAFDHPDLPESVALRGCSAPMVCLGRTKEGRPRHPLYVRADQELEPW
jgi:hypothetical protein